MKKYKKVPEFFNSRKIYCPKCKKYLAKGIEWYWNYEPGELRFRITRFCHNKYDVSFIPEDKVQDAMLGIKKLKIDFNFGENDE